MNAENTVTALAALAHPLRLAAYRTLVQAGSKGMSVGQLRDALEVPPATLTSHLNRLRAARLVRDEREGRSICVRADYRVMNALIGFLTENCCDGRPGAPAQGASARSFGLKMPGRSR